MTDMSTKELHDSNSLGRLDWGGQWTWWTRLGVVQVDDLWPTDAGVGDTWNEDAAIAAERSDIRLCDRPKRRDCPDDYRESRVGNLRIVAPEAQA
jgi:hypothetical protein